MNIKRIASNFLPQIIKDKIRSTKRAKDFNTFNELNRISCVTNNLRSIKEFSLSEILNAHEIQGSWNDTEREIGGFNIPDGTGGVNPGDRRALYYLVAKLKPTSVLEIGTHIGASILNIASALLKTQNKGLRKANITTVDIRDVNSNSTKPWLDYGATFSPLEMLVKLNYQPYVNFLTDDSLTFFSKCRQGFDLIFLDGDHSATAVYQEIPAALRVLNKNGIILLHDYFPDMRPLWSNGAVIEGPFMATERLVSEGSDLIVLPLGKLPWPTKLNSKITSLALLLRKS